ncbi:kinase-like protein [Pluteus cervinus]|uniref:Kinase-like protein n=1 Tax=Pluteus cervinus TaxID=181527 RepID=A0ACD3AH39_9AGAR|nr:kinase-like protein [Pluteus cervinus]
MFNLPLSITNPSQESVRDVLEKLSTSKESSPYSTWHNLQDGRCVKHGPPSSITISEAQIIEFVRQSTSIPIPKVHMVFEHENEFHIVMDFIEGSQLFPNSLFLPSDDQEVIAAQLGDITQQIRSLPLPAQTVLGSWEGGPYRNTYFRVPWDKSILPAAPFQSVSEFHEHWVKRGSQADVDPPSLPNPNEIPIVPTHGDLSGRNILIKQGRIVAVVDWETFGWYPNFWETMIIRRNTPAVPGWLEAFERAIGPRTSLDEGYIRMLEGAFREPRDWVPDI